MAKTPAAPRLFADWTVSVKSVPPSGLRVSRTVTEAELKPLARLIGVDAVHEASLTLLLTPEGAEGLHGTGEAVARILQSCVVTLEPLEGKVREPIDVSFAPLTEEDIRRRDAYDPEEDENLPDPPEPVDNGAVDLGQLFIEFLAVGIDPYPRKEGAVFTPPEAEEDEGPFAALKALKDKDS